MVSESDFIAAFQAYHDALEDPAAKVETIRPLVNDHLEQLIGRLPGATVQNAARQRAMAELDRIESLAKDKAVEIAEDIEEFEDEIKSKTQAITQTMVFVEPENLEVGTPFTVGFSGSSGSPQAWIGIYTSGAPHAEHGSNWAYVSGTQQPGEGRTAGSVTFSGDQYVAGGYDARLFRDNGHDMMASATFTISAPPEPEPEEPTDALRDAFNVFDRDGNGVIDIDELRHMMVALGENLSEEEVRATLTEADADGDGVINFEEFRVIMLMPRSSSDTLVEPQMTIEEPEEEESEEEEPETVVTSSGLAIGDVVSHLETLKLFGDKRRYIESLSGEVFDFKFKIEKMEKTIGIRLTDQFRGGNTCIGIVDEIGVGVRMPNTMEPTLGQEVFVEAKLLEYRSVVKRFEFEHL